jgi:hypothetical protein
MIKFNKFIIFYYPSGYRLRLQTHNLTSPLHLWLGAASAWVGSKQLEVLEA